MKRFFTPMNMMLCINIFVVLGFCWINSQRVTVATFNKELILSSFVKQLSTHALTDEALAQKTKRFNKALNLSLDEYAHHNHAVVLDLKTVSVSNNDATKDILVRVAKHMRDEA